MKDHRHGDELWIEWTGDGFEYGGEDDIYYYTIDHVSLDEDVVRRALASTLQRDGIADSLGDGFKLLEAGDTAHAWAGLIEEELDLTVCDADGETLMGDQIEIVIPITAVRICPQ